MEKEREVETAYVDADVTNHSVCRAFCLLSICDRAASGFGLSQKNKPLSGGCAVSDSFYNREFFCDQSGSCTGAGSYFLSSDTDFIDNRSGGVWHHTDVSSAGCLIYQKSVGGNAPLSVWGAGNPKLFLAPDKGNKKSHPTGFSYVSKLDKGNLD